MSTSPVTINSPSSLRQYLDEEIFSAPTEKLTKECPNPAIHGDGVRKWCLDGLWADHPNLSANIQKIVEMELEWRANPEKTELRPSLL